MKARTPPGIRHGLPGTFLLLSLLCPAPTSAQQEESCDYRQFNREVIRRGMQAVFLCNGLFTSNRTLEQVFAQEIAYIREPVGTSDGGDYEVDRHRKAVAIGAPGSVPIMRGAFRDGLGCVIMAPDQDFDDIESLPVLDMPPPPGDPATIPWPDGDLVANAAAHPAIDAEVLQAASDWAFDRESPEQVTLSLLVVHDGRIVHERYAPGVDVVTRTRTWSTAKSIAVTLIAIAADRGLLALDAPLGFEWLPMASSQETDPRAGITLRHVLNMSSGLYPVDNGGLEYATGSGLAYWAGVSSVVGARHRALIRQPGTSWDYENYDTLLGIYALRLALGDAYPTFPREALLDRIGMRNTLLSVDRFGDFILSSQVYTNARDLAALRPPVPQRRRLERRADPLRGVDRLCAHARADGRGPRQLLRLRGPVVAGAGQPDRRARRRLLHRGQPGTVRGCGADTRSGHRAPRAGLRPPAVRG